MTSKSSLAASAFVLALLATGTAKAQVPSTLAADFEVRIQRLERALSEMTGRYEEAGYEIRQLRDRIERMTGDLEFRLNALEGGGAGGRGGGSRASAPPPPPAQERPTSSAQAGNLAAGKPPAASAPAPLPNDPQKAYETAFGYLRDADYDKAEKALNEFLARNANHTLAGNAQYWLGETYFVRNKYPEAATAFATGIQKYPKGVKSPDNLLKFGMTLGKLNKKTEACTALAQLPQKYPEASAGLKKKAESERRTLNCPGA